MTLSIYNTELPNCCEIDPGTFLDSQFSLSGQNMQRKDQTEKSQSQQIQKEKNSSSDQAALGVL